MLQIRSQKESVSANQEKTFSVLTNFINQKFDNVPGLSDFQTFENGCQFNVQGGVACKLTLVDQQPFSKVAYKVDTDKNISADVVFDIEPDGANSSLQASLNADVPFFLQMMVKGMIEKFMGNAMQFLKTAIERS